MFDHLIVVLGEMLHKRSIGKIVTKIVLKLFLAALIIFRIDEDERFLKIVGENTNQPGAYRDRQNTLPFLHKKF